MGSSKDGHLRVVHGTKGQAKPDPLEVRVFGKTIRRQVVEFGAVIGVVLCLLAEYQYCFPGRVTLAYSLLGIAPVFYLLCRFATRAMLPVWKSWMKLGELMGHVVNFALLFVVWALMVVPFGLGLKLIGKKVMDLSYRAPVQSYWENRTDASADFRLLERQF